MDMNDDPVIVIVEDDPNIADLVELYLRRDGYRPYQASTGERALQVIAERNPELVLLDVGLPGELDGLGVCRAIRAESDIPIIFLTARDAEIDRVLGLELGADDAPGRPAQTVAIERQRPFETADTQREKREARMHGRMVGWLVVQGAGDAVRSRETTRKVASSGHIVSVKPSRCARPRIAVLDAST